MIMILDDSDMKIAGTHPDTDHQTGEDEALVIVKQRANGNLDLARSLGAQLAGEVWSFDWGDSTGSNIQRNANDQKQQLLLIFFAVNSALEELAPNSYIGKAAVQEYNRILENEAPDIYQLVENHVSLSFYYLNLRRGKQVTESMGRTFAMLCGQEGNESYAGLGCRLYTQFSHLVQAAYDNMSFAGLK